MEARDDLYDLLGLDVGVDAAVVSKAYKKRALKLHPDHGGDVEKFLELKQATDVLLDADKKEAYDKRLSQALQAKKKKREREDRMAEQRRNMTDELLRKEGVADQKQREQKKPKYRKEDLAQFRARGKAKQQDLADKLAQKLQEQNDRRKAKAAVDAHAAPKAQRTVKFKWGKKQEAPSHDSMTSLLETYGAIDKITIKSSSAKVVFQDALAAARAVRVEGHKGWRAVELQGHMVHTDSVPRSEETFASSREADTTPKAPVLPLDAVTLAEHLELERKVLGKLDTSARQATSAH